MRVLFASFLFYERKGVINLAVKQVTLEILEAIQWGIDEGTLFRYGSVI